MSFCNFIPTKFYLMEVTMNIRSILFKLKICLYYIPWICSVRVTKLNTAITIKGVTSELLKYIFHDYFIFFLCMCAAIVFIEQAIKWHAHAFVKVISINKQLGRQVIKITCWDFHGFRQCSELSTLAEPSTAGRPGQAPLRQEQPA